MISSSGKLVGWWDILHVNSAGTDSELRGSDAEGTRWRWRWQRRQCCETESQHVSMNDCDISTSRDICMINAPTRGTEGYDRVRHE